MTFSVNKGHAIADYLWIDALCINQADIEERGHQVSIMSPIFRQARTVHIWLGLHGTFTREALRALNQLLTFESMLTYTLEDDVLMGVKDFLSRAWWQRVWVISEVVVCSHPVLRLGNDTIGFRGVLKVLGDFNVGALRGSFSHLPPERRSRLENVCDLILRICASFNVQDLSKNASATIDDVLRLLNYGEAKKASDLRDLVYGFLGLLPRSLSITPDYGSSVEEVYKSTTMRLMTWSKSLTPIAFSRHRLEEKLPSWVPDLRCDLFNSDYSEFNASLDLPALIDESAPGQLRVYGKIIDTIALASSRCPILPHEPTLGTKWYNEFRIVLMHWHETAFLNTDLPDPLAVFDRSSRDSFWRAVMRDNPKSLDATKRYDRDRLCLSEIESWLLWKSDGQIENNTDPWLSWSPFLSGVSRAAVMALRKIRLEVDGCRFFRTNQGCFGQTSASPKHGDVIALLAGLRCPMIFVTESWQL